MNYLKIAAEVFDVEKEALEATIESLIHHQSENFQKVIELLFKCQGRVVVTGMGKSGLVGKKISATLASTGTRSFFMHPAEAYHGDLGMIDQEDVIIALSNSGETDELIKLLSFFQDNGNPVVAITANSQSTLAKNSTLALSLVVPREACPLELAPTSSTSVTLCLGDALAICLMKAKNFDRHNFARFHPGGSLGRKLLDRVSHRMQTHDLPIVSMTATFDEIIDQISKGRLGLCVVCENNLVKGIITDGDIRRLLTQKRDKALTLKAEDFYTKNPTLISPNEKIYLAEELMNQKKISALLVTQDGLSEQRLLGVIHRLAI